jgi:hypothetical protein
VRTHPDGKLLEQHCYKSAAGPGLQIIILLEGQMSGKAKNWSDIFQFFLGNGQSKHFSYFILKISTMYVFLPGHVSPQCNACI